VIKWIDSYSEQRFVLTVGAGIVDVILLVTKHIASSDYVTLTAATVGAFIVARAWENRGQQQREEPSE
jgi:hypothetical protein